MFRKLFIVVLMAPLLVAAAVTDASLPVLFMMISLLLIALAESSGRDEQPD